VGDDSVMRDRPPARGLVRSFVVRVYRLDPLDRRRIAGVIEAVDDPGTSTPFADATQLAEVVCALAAEEGPTEGQASRRSRRAPVGEP